MGRRRSSEVALPSGTVTFLFTDIEGSTQLLRRLGPSYAAVLQRHKHLLRSAVETHGGVDVDEDGDGLFFAFAGARSAVTACIDGQRALQGEPWAEGVELRVRMGLHTGEASPVEDNYVALAVHQAARVADAAHGGQVVVSQATAAAVHEALPEHTTLRDLGKHRLKDFDTPARLFQLCHPELATEFGDLRVAPDSHGPQDTVGFAATAPSPTTDTREDPTVQGFRTPGMPRGAFRIPGDFHVHIDGCRDPAHLFGIVEDIGRVRLDDGGVRFPGTCNRILRFAGGPQRDDRAFAETYRYHTPGSVQHERFDSFSTIWLGTGNDLEADAVAALARILHAVAGQPDAVVELERVIGVLESSDVWTEAPVARIADPESLDGPELAEFCRLATSGIEIHHSIDLPREDDRADPPLSVDELPTWPNLGGWFLFGKGDTWSYRSSEFVDRSGAYQYAVHVGHRRLSAYLEGLGRPHTLRTLVEQVLGIWRGGGQRTDGAQPITALAEWEMSAPPRGHVWVIAANFLGDSSPDVNRAMLRNIAEGVVYTYFLRTHADVVRLGLLAEGLERSMIAIGATPDRARRSVTGSVRFVLLSTDLGVDGRLEELLRSDYFLCPYDDGMGGYRLDSSGLSGERLDPDDATYLVEALNPLLEAKIRGLFSSLEEPWTPSMSHQAIVCTDLEETGRDQDQDPWLQMLAEYDRIVAREVSMHGGRCRVVRPVRNGYLLVFERPRSAAQWSRRLQFEVSWHNRELARLPGRQLAIPSHNIALGYGPVSRVLRAHGYDVIGGAIDDCIDLAATLRDQRIAMSGHFADQYESYVGKQEFAASTRTCTDPDLGPLTLLEWP